MDSFLALEDTDMAGAHTKFHKACDSFTIINREAVSHFICTLDELVKELALNRDLRTQIGRREPSIWPRLNGVWSCLSSAQPTNDEDEDKRIMKLCVALGKFTGNLVANESQNQSHAFLNEPHIRAVLHCYTSWSAMEHQESFLVTRVLTQTLSNMITSNFILSNKLWYTYMGLPEDQVVLLRLIPSPDHRTVMAAFVLVLNCIHGSNDRVRLLCTTKVGARICILILDQMNTMYDAEEASDSGKAFNLGYEIFTRVFSEGLFTTLFKYLVIEDEIVTPHQTTLLKLLDSFLQSTTKTSDLPWERQLASAEAAYFFSLSFYAQRAIRLALGHGSQRPVPSVSSPAETETLQEPVSPPQELDVMLPKVCEALVLVTQCIVTLALRSTGVDGSIAFEGQTVRDVVNDWRSSGDQGLVQSLIELLRLLDLFLPRINFGRPVGSLSHAAVKETRDPTAFAYVKRDLVRLLGILCHRNKPVQDLVRQTGGIPVVMNQCVIDERNPFLREHAIFTLRNLLEDNEENQSIVDNIRLEGPVPA